MQICIDSNNMVTGYADTDIFEDGITVEKVENEFHFREHFKAYKYIDGKLLFDDVADEEESRKVFKLLQEQKQFLNNNRLAEYLKSHPLLWSDGRHYGVTKEDQQEIALNLTQYQLTTSLGLPSKLERHAVKEECREFSADELTALMLQISAFVYPLIRKNQTYKAEIFSSTTVEDLDKIQLNYEPEE